MACRITYDGKEYTEEEFFAYLASGGLQEIVDKGLYSPSDGKPIPRGKGYLSPKERENLEKIGKEVGLNFREVQNIYNKYGDKGKDLSEIDVNDFNSAQEKRDESKMRSFSERVSEAPEYQNAKEQIEENPDSYYRQQNLESAKKKVEEMTPEERVEAMSALGRMAELESNSNLGVLAALYELEEMRLRGEDVTPLVEKISKSLTTMGQLIRQAAEFNKSTPEGLVLMVEKMLEKGDRYLTPEQKENLLKQAGEYLDVSRRLNAQKKNTQIDFTEENLGKIQELENEQVSKYKAFSDSVQDVTPKGIWDTLGMIVQGNLLTPKSLIVNIAGNLINELKNLPQDILLTLMNAPFKDKKIKKDIPVYAYAFKKGGNAFIDAFKDSMKGTQKTDILKGEVKQGFRPLRSLYQAISGEGLPVTSKGKKSMNDRIQKAIEGTFGIPAEIFFRSLYILDKPFLEYARAKGVMERARLKDLTGPELEKFLMFPDDKTKQEIDKEAAKAVFQEDSYISKGATSIINSMNRWLGSIPLMGNFFKFILKTTVPYVKTPSNIISQTLDYSVPAISIAKAFSAAKRQDYRNFQIYSAKALMGAMMYGAASTLFKSGLLSGAPDDEEKKKDMAYVNFPPNSLNVSGLKRMMDGGDPSVQPSDEFIDYSKLGIGGTIFSIVANTKKEEFKKEKKGLSKNIDDMSSFLFSFFSTLPASAQYSLEQSFLSGTNTFLEAVKDGEYEKWYEKMFGAISSIPLPNTLAAANRAYIEYMPQLRTPVRADEDFLRNLENIIRMKTFTTSSIPVRRDNFGRPVRQTSLGYNSFISQFLDFTNAKKNSASEIDNSIYRLYLNTDNADVYPSRPSQTMKIDGKTLPMSPEQYDKLLALEGAKKMEYANLLIKSQAWKDQEKEIAKSNSPTEKKRLYTALVKKLNNAYDKVSESPDVKKLKNEIEIELINKYLK